MIKVNEAWRLTELIGVHKYILTHGYGGQPYPAKIKKSGENLKLQIKKILKKDINIESLNDEEYLELLRQEIKEIFKKTGISLNQNYCLGPIGNFYNLSDGLFLDLDDIEEVYLSDENLKSEKGCGSIKSKSCGWIAWCTVSIEKKADKNTLLYIVSFNHFKKETAMKEVLEKKLKFNQEKLKRAIKNFFISNRHWYHDDLEKLNNQLPYINFLKY